MSFDVIIGRSKKEIEKFGTKGVILIGKQYVQMGTTTSLSNNVYLDMARSHATFICGKRGSGKSYSMGVLAEGVAKMPDEIRQNLSIILLDTMGIYWTMKYPNHPDTALLREWNMEPHGLDVKIFTPSGFYDVYKQKGIPTDQPFAIKPADLNPEDWCMTFGIDPNSPPGVLIARAVYSNEGKDFGINNLIKSTELDNKSDEHTKNVVINHFQRVLSWGIFSNKGTPLKKLAVAGQVTVLDMSPYATLPNGWLIKSLVIGLISKKLFTERMIARKNEEFINVDSAMHYFTKQSSEKLDQPLTWLVIDEAHEMLPNDGKTTATDALVTILREGRQPGISLVLASQQPGKIHSDVITQSDIVISHRLTAQIDVDALGQLTQTYMREGLIKKLDTLPRVQGAAVVFDDLNERIFAIQIRPRISWHGGSAPTALVDSPELFSKI
jgi:uncharacterized protein